MRYAPLVVLAGCAVEQWRNADLQLDIAVPTLPADTARVRVCVTEVGVHEQAVGAGRIAFPGLPADGPMTVTVDLLATNEDDTAGEALRTARAGPTTLDDRTPWKQVTQTSCKEGACAACSADGSRGTNNADRLLAVRYVVE